MEEKYLKEIAFRDEWHKILHKYITVKDKIKIGKENERKEMLNKKRMQKGNVLTNNNSKICNVVPYLNIEDDIKNEIFYNMNNTTNDINCLPLNQESKFVIEKKDFSIKNKNFRYWNSKVSLIIIYKI